MSSPPINIETKKILGYESYWDNEPAILDQDIVVLTRDTDTVKKGDGEKTFHDLPIKLKVSEIPIAENNLSYIDVTFDNLDEDRLAILDDNGKIVQSNLPNIKFDNLYKNINDNSLFTPLYINGPSKAYIGASIICSLEGFSAINKFHRLDNITSVWKLSYDPDNIIESSSNQLTINLPNDSSYIGQTITISGKLIDMLGNISKYITHDILITDSSISGYVSDTNMIIEGTSPIIASYKWNNDNHKINTTYALTIQIDNIIENQNVILSVICDNIEVSIIPDLYMRNKYLISYPNFLSNTNVNFKISLVNVYGYKDIKQFSKLVTI